MSNESKSPLFGRVWTNGKIYNEYESAAAEKKRIEDSSKDLSVKIRRTSENRFQIKTRSTVVAESKKQSSNPKTKSQRRKEKAARHKARQEKE